MKNLLLALGVGGIGYLIYNRVKKPEVKAYTYDLFPTTLITPGRVVGSGSDALTFNDPFMALQLSPSPWGTLPTLEDELKKSPARSLL